jgi:type II secretory pathway component PulM
MEKLRRFFADLSRYFQSLSPRERMLIGAAGGALAFFIGTVAVVGTTRAIRSRETSIEEKEKLLAEVVKLSATFRQAEAERAAIEGRLKGPGIRLFSYMEDSARKLNVEIGAMNDRGTTQKDKNDPLQESVVEVNLPRINVEKLARFLDDIERHQRVVKVKKLRLRRRGDDKEMLDVSVTVATYQLEG